MKTIYFNELGYMSKTQCVKIKQIMEGTTFMNFKVDYSNNCGNCTLICSTDYEADESKIRWFFLSALIGKLTL